MNARPRQLFAASSAAFAFVCAPAYAQSNTQAAQPTFGLPAYTTLPLNGSFEQADPFSPSLPYGWTNHTDLEPTWPLPSPIPAYEGDRVVALGSGQPGGVARQWSTDRQNFLQWPGGTAPIPYFDPAFDWNGGDVEIRLRYYIPSSSPITVAPFGVKLNAKGAADPMQDNATLDPFDPGGVVVSGHTSNQWREYVELWPIADIRSQVLANAVTFGWVLPPFPNRIKIVLQRFNPGVTTGTGTIYVDAVLYRQLPVAPAGCNLADITEIGGTTEEPGSPDGQLTVDDIIVFINTFSDSVGCPGPNPPSGPACSRADVTGIGGPPELPDGQLTVDDIIAFFNAFSDGCV